MSTQCVRCTQAKSYNCMYCGDPICMGHTIYNGKTKVFCSISCIREYRYNQNE